MNVFSKKTETVCDSLASLRKAIARSQEARHLNVLITETFELAESQWKQAERIGNKPFLLIVKDCFAVEDLPFTCASNALGKSFIPPYTATIVQRLLDKGGCIIGKSNQDEFAMGSTSTHSPFGPVKNSCHFETDPSILHSDWHIAGGSSGGSAVAVALGMAQIALGSDTGGSTRNPAAFNGVFGFKPSYGALSRYGLVPLANSFDSPSIFAQSAQDCRHFFDIMRGSDKMDSTSVDCPLEKRIKDLESINPKNTTIGIPKEYRNELLSRDSQNAWDLAIEALKSTGFRIQNISLPNTANSIICYHILAESDIASNMSRYDGVRFGFCADRSAKSFDEMITETRTEALNYSVKRRIFAGNFFNIKENRGKYFLQAAKVRRLIKQDFDRVFRDEKIDAILTPVTTHSAPLFSDVERTKFREQQRKDDFYTQPANMAGLPAISVPFSKCSNDLPLGVQLICDYLNDDLCLLLAEILFQSKKQ